MSKFIRKQKTHLENLTNKIPASQNDELTVNQKIFVDQWLIDRNGTRAYKVAYPHIKNNASAGVLSCQLLNLPKISKYIQASLKKISDNAEINVEWVLKRYKMLVDYSVNDFFDNEGEVKPLNEIPKDKLYAVCGFKANKTTFTNEEVGQIEKTIIREFKFPDKKGVLDSLAKYLGMFEKDNEQKRSIPDIVEVRIID